MVLIVLYSRVFPGLFVWQGLGKSEQGSTEHIKVKVKNNSLGLGTAVKHEVRNRSCFPGFEILCSVFCFFHYNL